MNYSECADTSKLRLWVNLFDFLDLFCVDLTISIFELLSESLSYRYVLVIVFNI